MFGLLVEECICKVDKYSQVEKEVAREKKKNIGKICLQAKLRFGIWSYNRRNKSKTLSLLFVLFILCSVCIVNFNEPVNFLAFFRKKKKKKQFLKIL